MGLNDAYKELEKIHNEALKEERHSKKKHDIEDKIEKEVEDFTNSAASKKTAEKPAAKAQSAQPKAEEKPTQSLAENKQSSKNQTAAAAPAAAAQSAGATNQDETQRRGLAGLKQEANAATRAAERPHDPFPKVPSTLANLAQSKNNTDDDLKRALDRGLKGVRQEAIAATRNA